MFDLILFRPILNLLIFFYRFTNNLGLAIVAMTLIIRGGLTPLTRPATQTAEKMKQVQAELEKLKQKYKDNTRGLQEEQLKLYRRHGINPAAGCLPQLIQLIILIALFRVFSSLLNPQVNPVELINEKVYFSFLKLPQDVAISTRFLYLDLTKPDLISLPRPIDLGLVTISRIPGLFLISAVLFQFISSKMMMPVVKSESKLAKQTKEKSDDFSTIMQEQMLYTFPLMTLLIGIRFPSGLVLYWLTFSVFLMWEQYRRQRRIIPHGIKIKRK
jgi:YidC/Oxa1 family membrane protein insertase